jgi:cohesin complex subunit SA-1/2
MIDQALNVLTLHVIWKARRLPTEVQPSPDDTRLRESFLEQRGTLLKRLVEYAVGSQSNTTDGVRRAASTPALLLAPEVPPDQSKNLGFPEPPEFAHSLLPTAGLDSGRLT